MDACLPLSKNDGRPHRQCNRTRRDVLEPHDSERRRGPVADGNVLFLASLSMPRKLIRSVRLKLRRWRHRLAVDGEATAIGMSNDNENVGGSSTCSAEEFSPRISGSAGPPVKDMRTKENDKWKMIGCFGSQGRIARLVYVGRDEASNSPLSYNNKDDASCEVERNRYRAREGSRRRMLGRRPDHLDAVDFSRVRNRGPVQEIAMGNPAQLEPEQLNDDAGSGRQQCGCFANSRMDGSKDGGRTRAKRWIVEILQTDFDAKARLEHPGLPDDVVEMCLARTPFSTLAQARLVCRKWRSLTMSPHFLAMREKLSSRKPWLLLFGFSRDGVSTGQIHALDPTFDRWHSIRADMLARRFLFSVASANGLVYVVGGCSSSFNDGLPDKSTVKTHKTLLVYNPLTGSWTKLRSMGTARAMAVVGVFEMKGGRIVKETGSRSTRGSRNEGCHNSDTFAGIPSHGHRKKEGRLLVLESNGSKPAENGTVLNNSSGLHTLEDANHAWGIPAKDTKTYGLMVVGGHGHWNEPLFSAEIYDPSINRWREIAKLPSDHGVTCAGVVCNGAFYSYSESDKLAAYDFDLNLWTGIQISNTVTRLNEYMPKLASCKGRIFLVGVAWEERESETGVDGRRNDTETAARILWELNPSSQAWLQISKHPDAPLDWNAIFVAEGEQLFAVEMFKIFGQVLDFITVCDLSGPQVKWKRVSRMRIINNVDVSSCITKSAIVVQL